MRATFDAAQLGQSVAGALEGLVVALVVFLAYYLMWRIADPVSRRIIRRTRLDATTAAFATTVLKYGIVVVAILHGFRAAGINTAGILTSLGIAGLTIGFAARDALSNIISGLLIFWDRPFVIGDLIEVGDSYGRVETITLRSTRVVTVDGKMLAVPNTQIINSTVSSYTNFPHLRIDVGVAIGTSANLNHVREILLSLVQSDPSYRSDPAPVVVVKSLNDYNIEIGLRAWLDDERQHVPQRFALRERVFDAMRSHGVEMPFQTVQLTPVTVNIADGRGGSA